MPIASGAAASAPECPACGAAVRRQWARKGEAVLLECERCGTILAASSAAASQYEHYHDHATFDPASDTVARSLLAIVLSAEPFRQGGRWLDLGYGEGALLDVADRHGWRAAGVEVSPAALRFGESRGWTVTDDVRRDPRFQPGSFDVVTLIEVLEHVARPSELLAQAALSLRPGGLLYLTTPNGRSLNRWVLGARWSVFCPPEHLSIWTAAGLRQALGRAGFADVHVKTEGLNPVEIAARLRPARAGSPNRQEAGLRLSRALSTTPSRRAFKQAANAVLRGLGLGDTLKARAVRARKRSGP